MPDEPNVDPVRTTKEEYGDAFSADLLEQYKLYVQSAENISSNRIATSRYLLTLNAALLALYGFQPLNLGSSDLALAIPVTGVLVSALWYRIIKSYRNLNGIKFELIHKLEERLPATLFKTEWDVVKKRSGRTYIPVTKIEQWLPLLFIAAHTFLPSFAYFGVIGPAA